MNDDNVVVSCIGIIVSLFALFLLGAVVNGFVLSKLWEWFMVPLFELRSLNIAQAIGVAMVIQAFVEAQKPSNDMDSKTYTQAIVQAAALVVSKGALTLLMAWVVRGFI